ncbi:MAG: AAA family ATPase [Nocardioidaceae bacterium]
MTAAEIVALARSRPATLGAGRLLCVDGPAGAGKTTLAAALGSSLDAPVIHLDDLYEGWAGIEAGRDALEHLLRDLATGSEASYRRFDWHAYAYAEQVAVPSGPWLVVEGCGSWSARWADLVTTLVWVEAPPDLCLERGIARDGETMREQWLEWQHTQAEVFAAEHTRQRADFVHSSTDRISRT